MENETFAPKECKYLSNQGLGSNYHAFEEPDLHLQICKMLYTKSSAKLHVLQLVKLRSLLNILIDHISNMVNENV